MRDERLRTLLAQLPAAIVLVAVAEPASASAVHGVVLPVALVDGALHEVAHALTGHAAVGPLARVEVAVGVRHPAEAMAHAALPRALDDVAHRAHQESVAVELTVVPVVMVLVATPRNDQHTLLVMA